MPKILVAMRGDINAKNGSAFHLRNLKECLEKNGHEFLVMHCPDGPLDAPLGGAELEKAGSLIKEIVPDVVLADYSWMANVFDVVPYPVKKIVFVHDLRCRIVPCLEAIGYKDTRGWTEEKEGKFLERADYLLVLNNDDEAICGKYAPCIRIGIAMEPVPHDAAKEIPGRCIYVGSNNAENKYAIEWFLKDVWPKVKTEVPHASLTAVLGFDENLEQHYAEAQIAVVPHIMAGGLKIKTAEAMAYGIPVVGNSCAFDGFEEGLMPATDDPDEFSKRIVQIIKDEKPRVWNLMAQRICEVYMTAQAAYGQLLDILV